MRGLPVPSVASVERAAIRSAPLVRAQLPLIEDMLADGRTWICGDRFTVADLSVFHAVWFLTDRSARLAYELEGFSALQSWMERVRRVEHGRREEISAEEALTIACSSEPVPSSTSGARHPEDPEYGSLVEVRPDDYAKDAIMGTLEFLDLDEIAVRIRNDRVGDIVVHFPRIGFELREARN
jgi:hypothetical protein